jgi:hypothetical protein
LQEIINIPSRQKKKAPAYQVPFWYQIHFNGVGWLSKQLASEEGHRFHRIALAD